MSVAKENVTVEHVNIILIGHVDAGKSTLGGCILYATGMVDERTMDKLRRDAKEAGREAWYLSWALDLGQEERAAGKTVEVGRGSFRTKGETPQGYKERTYTVLDAPGHKSYVPNMIGGASQADIGILVVSARKGEYETGFERGGQTREHAVLTTNAGVRKLVIAVNKMDDPTVEWSEARFKECTVKVGKFLEALGYKKADIYFIPISAQTTTNIDKPIPEGVCPWYKGACLLEYLHTLQLPERRIEVPFMMPVSAKFRDLGTMIDGRVEAGRCTKNVKYIMMPNREEVSISALFYADDEEEIETAVCGDQIRARVRNIEEEDINAGFVLCSPDRLVHCVKSFEAKIKILDLKNILTVGYNAVLHVHAAQEEVTFASLLHVVDNKGRLSKKPPPFASKGQTIIARLDVIGNTGKVCLERYEDHNQLGRITLRDQVCLLRTLSFESRNSTERRLLIYFLGSNHCYRNGYETNF